MTALGMHVRRFLVGGVYPALLVAGVAFAISGVVVAVQRYADEVAHNGADWWRFAGWYVLSHAGTGIALLLLSLAYGVAYMRRPLRAAAPLAYLVSYGLCGLAFLVVLESAGKADTSNELLGTLVSGGIMFIAPALLLATVGVFWTTKPR